MVNKNTINKKQKEMTKIELNSTKKEETKEKVTKENGRKKLLEPKIDVVFQCLFSKNNEEITKEFVEVLLEEKIKEIKINDDKEIIRKKPKDKLGVLDLQLEINKNKKVDVEIQLINRDNFVKRLIWYLSKMYSNQMKKGDKYEKIKKVVLVAITDFELEETKEIEEMETIWKLIETKKREKILTEDFELRIINMKKAKAMYERNKEDKKAQWMLFIDNPNSEEVSQIMEENEGIKKAVEKVEEMTEDEEMERIAFLRQKAIWDEIDSITTGDNRGKKIGREQERKEIVESMLENKMDDEIIKKITKITQEELEKIKDEMKSCK